jgi:AcrR family transcriptional regulator
MMSQTTSPKSQLERRRRSIEDAAQSLFCRQGFNGVGLRDLAREADVSLGNIYNHFPSKEPIFAAIVDRLYGEFAGATEPLAELLRSKRFPDDLRELGRVMRRMVERHRDYLTLVYVDIAELGGKHVRAHYAELAARFRAALGPDATRALPSWADPGVVFALIYMQFSSFFVIERLVGATGHLGLSEDDAIDAIAQLFMLGLAPRPSRRSRDATSSSPPSPRVRRPRPRTRQRGLRGRVGAGDRQ